METFRLCPWVSLGFCPGLSPPGFHLSFDLTWVLLAPDLLLPLIRMKAFSWLLSA